MLIRTVVNINYEDAQCKLSLDFYTKYVSDETMNEIITNIENNIHNKDDLSKILEVLVNTLRDIDL